MVGATLEQEILKQVRKLDLEHQRQVLDLVLRLNQPGPALADWLEQARALQAELRAAHGGNFVGGSQSVLDEVREERLDDLLGGC